MPAQTKERVPPMTEGVRLELPMAANTRIWQGALVCLNGAVAVPGSVSTTLRAIGLAEDTVNNNPGAAGAQRIRVLRGVFGFMNEATDLITVADIGADCFIMDDQTVARTNGTNTRSRAGVIVAIEGATVFVRVGL